MSRSERHAALAWAEQIGAQARAAQSMVPWRDINAAIEQQLTHGAAALFDPGTESLFDQALQPCRPQEPEPMIEPLTLVQRPAGARTEQPSESTRRRWARMAEVESAAREFAHADGVRQGYKQGWRWGLACGVLAGALLAGVCWGTWLVVNVPDAVPSAMARPL
jgi:hypothetical protein